MRVALMQPRFQIDSNIPLGIAYIAAYLNKKGFKTDIIDLTFEGRTALENRLKQLNPDVLGLSTVSTNFEDAVFVAGLARSFNSKIKIILGGPQATVLGEKCFDYIDCDAVVIGEGEVTMYELLKAFADKTSLGEVRGIVFKEEENIIATVPRPYVENLDDIPFPARELFPVEKYLESLHGRISWAVEAPAITLLSSRGCPYTCTYCSSFRQFGRKVRFRSVENVLAEVDYLVDKYKIRGLYFWDDTFVLNKKRVIDICKGLKKYNLKWYAQSRVDTADKEMFEVMKESGCKTVSFGVESGSQRILDNYLKKGVTVEQIRSAVKLAKNTGFQVHCSFMVGTPGEKKEDIEKTIKLAKEIDPDVIEFNITTPLYGTELREIVLKEGTLLTDKLFGLNVKEKSVFKTKDLSPELVSSMYKRAVREFYFRPRYILKQLYSIKSYGDFKRKIRGFLILVETMKWGN